MASLNLLLTVSAYSLFRSVRRLGVVGLFLLGALDSSFLVLPFGNDLMLIALVSSSRSDLMSIAYVLASVAGSVLGVFVIDGLMRKTGEKGLQRFVGQQKLEQLKSKLETKAWLTIFAATLLPPPFPFTPVLMTASALQTPRRALFSALIAGRLIRFSTEAVLALYWGRQIIRFLNSPAVEYSVYGLIVIAIVLSVISVLKWVRKPHERQRSNLQDQRS
ncbi:MAG TPA: VTT domain-containing protein [Pyrinomonadaceae bacterium]|nr:VTT domain-containing protein [Pyrinomonadaceae bacterium]